MSTCAVTPACNGHPRNIAFLLPTPFFRHYEDYLRKDRGLTENSVLVYAPFIRAFLATQTTQTGLVSPESFDTLIMRDFILEQTANRSSEYTRLLCTALRSFFRFLVLCGQTSRDLSNAVPMFRKYRQSVPPAFLSPSEVEQVLAATGSTAQWAPRPRDLTSAGSTRSAWG